MMPDSFRGKKFTVMGLDGCGRGLKDARFLLEHGAEVLGTDLKEESDLPEAVSLAREFKNFSLALGGHRLEDFRGKDFIIRAALAPIDSPYLAEARKNNVPVVSDETLFLLGAPTIKAIGITGTRGKTTVTHMIHEILKACDKRVFLGGNIENTALLPFLDKAQDGDYVVMELDSWKLQSFAENKISPSIAVFTTFYRDHMNYYKDNMDAYWRDKSAIFANQDDDDVLILGSQVAKIFKNKRLEKKHINLEALPPSWELKILGEHNRENAAMALAAARAVDIPDEISKEVLENFAGVPGRLEFLGEKSGIKYFNDTTATSPEGVIAAFDALEKYKRRIILIGGGADKNLEYKNLAETIPQFIKGLILFKGSASDKMLKELRIISQESVLVDPRFLIHNSVTSMQEAFGLALSMAKEGDIILLSPGAASFGVFKNEYDRGNQFNELFNRS